MLCGTKIKARIAWQATVFKRVLKVFKAKEVFETGIVLIMVCCEQCLKILQNEAVLWINVHF